MKMFINSNDLTHVCETALESVSKQATLSPMQKAYRKLIRDMTKEKGLTSPFDQEPEDIAQFFQEASNRWSSKKKDLMSN